MMFRAVFWVVQVDNHVTRQYNPEDSSEHEGSMFHRKLVTAFKTTRCHNPEDFSLELLSGQVISIPALCSGGPRFRYLPGDLLSGLRFCGFLQSLHANAYIVQKSSDYLKPSQPDCQLSGST
jgi:hypothetical protein